MYGALLRDCEEMATTSDVPLQALDSDANDNGDDYHETLDWRSESNDCLSSLSPSSIPSSKDIRDMFVGFQEALYSKEA